MNGDAMRAMKWPMLAGAVLTAALVAVLAFGSSAAALLHTAAASGSTYKLQTVKVAGQDVVARWNPCQKDITYKINLSGVAKSDQAAMTAEIKAGVARLAAADGLTYRYTGTTTFVPTSQNLAGEPAEIVVAVVDKSATDLPLAADSLGYGGTLNATWTGGESGAAVVRGFVVLDAATMPGLKSGFGKGKTQGAVILHELGHATGLEHPTAQGEIMNATLTSADPAGYAAGDKAGLAKVGAGAGCITIPSSVKIKNLS